MTGAEPSCVVVNATLLRKCGIRKGLLTFDQYDGVAGVVEEGTPRRQAVAQPPT